MREVRGQMLESIGQITRRRLKWWQLLWWLKGCFEPDANSQKNYMREDAWCTRQNRGNLPRKEEVKEGGAYI